MNDEGQISGCEGQRPELEVLGIEPLGTRSWKVAVRTRKGGEQSYNLIRYNTKEEAEEGARSLARRWTAVYDTEVQPSEDEPNMVGGVYVSTKPKS